MKNSKAARKRQHEKHRRLYLKLKTGESALTTSQHLDITRIRPLSDCARIMGISRARAQQLERTALYKLRVGLLHALHEVNPRLASYYASR